MNALPNGVSKALRILTLPLLLSALPALPLTAQDGGDLFGALGARNIGPAGMSGRVTVVDVDPTDPTRIFVGGAAGGVWRSLDGGITWHHVFADQPVQSIGHLAISPANPDLVWVGTGEGNPRQSVGVGGGVFRSEDGGNTWTRVGLEASEHVARVIAHPRDADVAWVGAMGPLWADGGERGVYRTRDRGESWERVLYVDERTGVADMVLDPSNPDKLFVAMYDHRRYPWNFESGGPGSGIWVSRDGGDHWTLLGPENGLPEGPLGRIGLAIAASSPDVVYALVEAHRNALLRSDDGGLTWRTVSDEPGISPRPNYFADIRVDPSNENRVYRLANSPDVSEDAGRTWRTVVPSSRIHGDIHELWIDPVDSRHMIVGGDGGLGITWDRGGRWRFVENLPLSQFYHVSVDMEVPFNVYGGVQDSGDWMGPSTVWDDRGIVNAHWLRISCCDGFHVFTDYSDTRFGFASTQNGSLRRFDKVTMEERAIVPASPDSTPLRFNWNAAVAVDARDSTVLYIGSQYVHRTRDSGMSWEVISPDLTKADPSKIDPAPVGDPAATERDDHATILSIDASPLQDGVLWVSTDDGNVQLTRDGGATWTSVGGSLPGAPDSAYVPRVKASMHEAAGAYVVVDDHRRGDMSPYAYRTGDWGASWTRLATGGIRDFFHVIEEDPVEPNLLFLGGELGLYVSLDRGASWIHWTGDFGTVPVRDIIVHPRDHDLVVATHGRAIWIVDDIRPLRALAADPGLRARAVHLFEAPPARQHVVALEGDLGIRMGYRVVGDAMFFGESRPYGALLTYWVGDEAAGSDSAQVEIQGAGGGVVRRLQGPAEAGLNRVAWDLHMGADWAGGEGSSRPPAPEVLPGTYQVSVRVGGQESRGTVEVVADPRQSLTLAQRREKLAALTRVGGWVAVTGQAAARLRETRQAVEGVVGSPGLDPALVERGRDLLDQLDAAGERVSELSSTVRDAFGPLSGVVGPPSANDRVLMDRAEVAAREVVEAANSVLAGPVAAFRSALGSGGFSPIPAPAPLPGVGPGG